MIQLVRLEGALGSVCAKVGLDQREIGSDAMNDAQQQSVEGSMSHVMYDRIQARIMALDLGPGERLSVEALAREFDVSPTPIREALSRLEADGLVRKTHLRGFRVAPQQTRPEFESMFEVRALLEPHAAGRAAILATDRQRQQIAATEQAMASVDHSSGAGYQEFALLDAQFHQLIAEASGNSIISETLERLHVHLHLFRLRKDSGIADHALTEHRLIVQAIESGDEMIAEAAMRSHIARSLSRTRTVFDTHSQDDSIEPETNTKAD